MSKKLRTEAVDHLFDAILSLENREECYTFFEDVCTVNELLSLSRYVFWSRSILATSKRCDKERSSLIVHTSSKKV